MAEKFDYEAGKQQEPPEHDEYNAEMAKRQEAEQERQAKAAGARAKTPARAAHPTPGAAHPHRDAGK